MSLLEKNMVMKKILCAFVAVLLCSVAFSQADKAKYYIEGNYTITQSANGQFVYQLTDITSKGIQFAPVQVIYGKKENDESISFTFDKATTDCPDGFSGGLKFWKWQSNGKEYTWQRDSEVKDAQQEFETDKVMVVMLVLDCSNSLGNDNFEKLKSSATKFINILYNASPDGSIRLGVIGFNTMGNADKMTHEIEPLTAQSRDEMIRFIQNMTLYNNTALYYAMHRGSDMIDQYVANLSAVDAEKFDYACMVSFTDGYDNHSMSTQIGVPREGLDNPYYQYVRDHVVNHSIANSSLKSYVIAIRGNDVSEDNKLYKAVFDGLSSEEPFLLSDFNQLETQFESMAQELIKRWQNLTCYVPSAHQGKVRWTIGDFTDRDENKIVEEPKEEKKTVSNHNARSFFGVHGGVGFELAPNFYPVGIGTGIEFAVPTNRCAIGGLAALKYDFLGPLHMDLGALAIFGDYNTKKAFMGGIGLDFRFGTAIKNNCHRLEHSMYEGRGETWEWIDKSDKMGAGIVLRLGVTMPKHLYFFADMSIGGYKNFYNVWPNYGEEVNSRQELRKNTYFNFSLNVGYRFGK